MVGLDLAWRTAPIVAEPLVLLVVPSPLQVNCREESCPGMAMDLAVEGGVLKQGSPESRDIPIMTFRMELSCRVFLVSYPSSKQHRTVNPEPANSARFRSAKPSCGQEKTEKKLKRDSASHKKPSERMRLWNKAEVYANHCAIVVTLVSTLEDGKR